MKSSGLLCAVLPPLSTTTTTTTTTTVQYTTALKNLAVKNVRLGFPEILRIYLQVQEYVLDSRRK